MRPGKTLEEPAPEAPGRIFSFFKLFYCLKACDFIQPVSRPAIISPLGANIYSFGLRALYHSSKQLHFLAHTVLHCQRNALNISRAFPGVRGERAQENVFPGRTAPFHRALTTIGVTGTTAYYGLLPFR